MGRVSVKNRLAQKRDMDNLALKNLNDVKITRSETLENVDDTVDINRAWESSLLERT
jgi:hypothetical protein